MHAVRISTKLRRGYFRLDAAAARGSALNEKREEKREKRLDDRRAREEIAAGISIQTQTQLIVHCAARVA